MKCIRCLFDRDKGAFLDAQEGHPMYHICGSCRIVLRLRPNLPKKQKDYTPWHQARKLKKSMRVAKETYKVSELVYQQLLRYQDYKCFGCKSGFYVNGRDDTPRIDHDHSTGNVRGLLCNGCNLALGNIKDSTDTLLNLCLYLNQPPMERLQQEVVGKVEYSSEQLEAELKQKFTLYKNPRKRV